MSIGILKSAKNRSRGLYNLVQVWTPQVLLFVIFLRDFDVTGNLIDPKVFIIYEVSHVYLDFETVGEIGWRSFEWVLMRRESAQKQ